MTTIPGPKAWFGVGAGKIEVTLFYTFGWKVHRHVMPAGALLKMVSAGAVDVKSVPNRAMFVKGRGTVQNDDGTTYPDRVAGLYTQERTGSPAGTTTVTSVDDMEFWCFNYVVNRHALPDLTAVRLQAGDTYNIRAGTKLFVMAGKSDQVEGPSDFSPEHDTTLTAKSPFYAFVILKDRV